MGGILTRIILASLGFLVAACATLPTDYPRTSTQALGYSPDTPLGRAFGSAASSHPGKSGYVIIREGREAFTSRIMLTELAEKSLDFQYYIWEPDATGRIFADRILRAADRGVRVRILVDDISASGRDAQIAAMDAHPNVEIRTFNPFASRTIPALDFIADFDRVNHRMHNKVMIADNAIAIVGGRNVGDDYFQVDPDSNYRDLDIATVGPLVQDISNVFDHFWNGSWAFPISALVDRDYGAADLKALRSAFSQMVVEDDYPYDLDQDVGRLRGEIAELRRGLIWAPGQIVWDDPEDIRKGVQPGAIFNGLLRKLETLRHELLVESAYFVVRDAGVRKLGELNQRGVRVRVLTNSLMSNDVIAAHAGHAERRQALVQNGVELYEMRADAGVVKRRVVSTGSKASLHVKAMVFDRQSVFIGSFNLDPRSAAINTEAGLYVESRELAKQVIAFMDQGVLPENSYRVLLDEDGDLVWQTEVDGKVVRFDREPGSTFANGFVTRLIQILPVEDLL